MSRDGVHDIWSDGPVGHNMIPQTHSIPSYHCHISFPNFVFICSTICLRSITIE
jgi:hypothetical protein